MARKKAVKKGITAIKVRGFKSIYDETELENQPLTILAGANSSGKSSMMQPLLLLKQTLEATYDPGPLLLNGPNVKFTGTEHALEMFSNLGMGPSGRILIGLIEVLAALLILLPQSAVYGAFLGLGVMIGATIAHLTMLGFEGLAHSALVTTGCVMLLYLRRHDASFLRNLWDR